jgi:VWFA-related protein
VAGLAGLPGAEAQAPPPGAPSVFSADTGVVVLDVVVRDKKGHTVRDLTADQLAVYEDGVRQTSTAFRFVETPRLPVPVDAVGEPSAPPSPPAQVSLCTLLFDQLGPAGRRMARQAALEFLDLPPRAGEYVSVFTITDRLRLVQQFTTDRAALRKAVEDAASQSGPTQSNDSERADRLSKEEGNLMTGLEALTQSQGPSAALAQEAATIGQQAAMLRMALDAIRFTDSLQRQQQGESSLFALIALAKQQQRLAGRKTIVYFSEGLHTTSIIEQTFRSAISAANRANVSVYAVDARGLTTGSDYNASRDLTRKAAEAVRRQMVSRAGAAVTREEALAGETNEEALRANTQDTLSDLAQGTGGFLIGNTNDLRAGLERMADDVTGYYEVVYSPKNMSFDGGFRRLEVKPARSGLVVQARSGYFALPPGEGTATFPYELPLLASLRAEPPPHDFAHRSTLFHFDSGARGSLESVALEVPVDRIGFRKDGGSWHGHFRIMAVMRSPTRGIVEKFVQDFPLDVPDSKYEALKRGTIFFTRSFRLEPGRYRLETVVADEVAKKSSVGRSEVEIKGTASPVFLSSLAIVKRTESVPAGALESDDPFRIGTVRLVPYVGEPTLAKGDSLSVFLTAVTNGESQAPAELQLEFLTDGAVVGRSNALLPAPDEQGRIPYMATIPCDRFSPGRVELRATLRRGSHSADASTFFSVAPGGS